MVKKEVNVCDICDKPSFALGFFNLFISDTLPPTITISACSKCFESLEKIKTESFSDNISDELKKEIVMLIKKMVLIIDLE